MGFGVPPPPQQPQEKPPLPPSSAEEINEASASKEPRINSHGLTENGAMGQMRADEKHDADGMEIDNSQGERSSSSVVTILFQFVQIFVYRLFSSFGIY